MKNLILLFLLLPAYAAVQPDMSGISQALRNGNADALGAYFGSSVEISILDKEDRYNKAEAVKVLKDFFTQNRPSGFNPVHKGVSKGGNLHYSIGEMQTPKSTYRVYLLLEEGQDNYIIQQLRIDEQ
ncbi:MAG: DUF4783 domain-containing protein [Saprospiraceae bacterium]|nr:DUF4783 domain-containing protein [Saprospiraceae bacterium]MCB0626799.1 DUF4783 domain-containing protein [Saprospiraceae bacterium]MCB0676219.1 DUF4783 domain-containing protein [Saprospiraceae bacterium]MCB0682448.1 DUF4783 domain-containing protein [Saprospiraceae bacterium]